MSENTDQPPSDISTGFAPSPLQKLKSPLLETADIQLYVKRDDLIHPQFGGNKWRKLKYNLLAARAQECPTLLTFGGAWSNHIHATAAAGKYLGFNTIGIIRGEQHSPLNSNLSFAESCGMQLHYIDRKKYRKKFDPEYLQTLKQKFGDIYILPEGGSNALALQGCKEIVSEINDQLPHHQTREFDIICCASGTGATLAGLISTIAATQTAIGFSALKGGDFLNQDVVAFLDDSSAAPCIAKNWEIETRFHFGGYARINDELRNFMKNFHKQFDFELDAVYNAKMFYGIFQNIESHAFKPGTTIIAIHSGGLQGNKGFNL